MKIQASPESKRYLLLLYALITGVLFDILFYNKTLGISYIIFIIAVMAFLFTALRSSLSKLNKRAWLFALPITLLSSTYFIYSNRMLKLLNFFIIPLLIIIMAIFVAGINKSDWSGFGFIADIAKRIFVPFRFLHRPFIFSSFEPEAGADSSSSKADDGNIINADKKTYSSGRQGNRVLLKIILGVAISIPVLAIILLLLSSADMVFKNLFINMPVLKIFKHFIIIMLIFIYSAGFIWSLLKALGEKKETVQPGIKSRKQFIDPVVLLTILMLLNAVYGIFSAIQFKYLFGGDSFILPSSFSYAEYARRGFAELVAVTVINFAILAIGLTFVKKHNKKIFNAIKSLFTLLVVFTFIMLASAFYRMTVYEQAYGFTYLRIFVQAFMSMLFFMFIINFVYIWYRKLPIIKSYFIVALSVYIILNFANVDCIIATGNIDRYYKTGSIDEVYLNQLSYEAIPQINKFLEDLKDSPGPNEKKIISSITEDFRQEKENLLFHKSWQSFNISKNRALEILVSISGERD